MASSDARNILTEHAGTQWDETVVAALLDADLLPAAPTVLADVGSQIGGTCTADLPMLDLRSADETPRQLGWPARRRRRVSTFTKPCVVGKYLIFATGWLLS
jgi:hypothetical protein